MPRLQRSQTLQLCRLAYRLRNLRIAIDSGLAMAKYGTLYNFETMDFLHITNLLRERRRSVDSSEFKSRDACLNQACFPDAFETWSVIDNWQQFH